MRLGVLASHPIQYYAPLYRALATMRSVDLKVYFAHRPTPAEQGIGFNVPFTWDVDLTSGFESEFLSNVARAATHGRVRGRFSDYDTPEIGDVIERERFDAFLVHGWNALAYWQAMRACWTTRTPVFVRADSQLRDDRPVKQWVKRAIYPAFIRRFKACLSVGARSDAYFRHYGARRVVRSPHFVDNDAFASAANAARPGRDALRSAWGIPRDHVVALFAGKLVADKRPLDLVDAVKRVPGTHALFVGDGPLRPACGLAARRAGAPVSFAGFQNQGTMPRLYAAADVLVLPSKRRETWGLVVNEAMASGIPVIVSEAAGCVPDLVREGETGYAYRAGDVGALADALSTLAADPARRTRMGVAASEHVAAFSADRAAEGILDAVLA